MDDFGAVITKENRKYIKKYENEIKKIVKLIVKKYGYKSYDNCYLHKRLGDYFFYGNYTVYYIDGEYTVTLEGYVKKTNYDSLLWTILEMEDNEKMPDSFRCWGAFVAHPIEFASQTYIINDETNFEELIIKMVEQLDIWFNEILNIECFNDYVFNDACSACWDIILPKVLSLLDDNKFEKAKEYSLQEMEKGKSGPYIWREKSFLELVVEYCDKHLKE